MLMSTRIMRATMCNSSNDLHGSLNLDSAMESIDGKVMAKQNAVGSKYICKLIYRGQDYTLCVGDVTRGGPFDAPCGKCINGK